MFDMAACLFSQASPSSSLPQLLLAVRIRQHTAGEQTGKDTIAGSIYVHKPCLSQNKSLAVWLPHSHLWHRRLDEQLVILCPRLLPRM